MPRPGGFHLPVLKPPPLTCSFTMSFTAAVVVESSFGMLVHFASCYTQSAIKFDHDRVG